jgi:3-oxoadipate enol-lactonase
MTENQVVTRLGTNLHYWTTGDKDKPLVALAHGATMDHRTFDVQLSVLVEAGYRTLTWDLRGHGKSVPLGEQINITILADDLKAIVDMLAASRVTLVGHSFGGFVMQEFTHRYPDRVSALAVIGCTNLAKKSSPFLRMLYRMFPKILSHMSLETFRKRTLTDLSISQTVREYAADAMEGISKEDFIAITMAGIAALWLDSGFGPDYVIPRPFLLTHGDQDQANGSVYPRLAPAWARREPNCVYKIIPDAGHTAHMDNPAAFNEILLDFLNAEINNGYRQTQ